jgi:TonB family protein
VPLASERYNLLMEPPRVNPVGLLLVLFSLGRPVIERRTMKILRISTLASLALTVGAPVWAQSPAVAPAPTAQASPAPAPLSKRERIELCQKKKDVPLEPTDPQPLYLGGKDGTISRPTLLHGERPTSFSRATGKGIVEVIIDEDGCIRQIRVLKASRNLDAQALEAVQRWVFQPAMKDGHPVRVYYVLTIEAQIR